MTHIKQVVAALLAEIKTKSFLPDMAESLLESALEDGRIPEPIALQNIYAMIQEKGFPVDKRARIERLLEDLTK